MPGRVAVWPHLVSAAGKKTRLRDKFRLTMNLFRAILLEQVNMASWTAEACGAGGSGLRRGRRRAERGLRPQPELTHAGTRRRRERQDPIHDTLCVPAALRETYFFSPCGLTLPSLPVRNRRSHVGRVKRHVLRSRPRAVRAKRTRCAGAVPRLSRRCLCNTNPIRQRLKSA